MPPEFSLWRWSRGGGGGSFLLPTFKLKDLAEVNIDSSFWYDAKCVWRGTREISDNHSISPCVGIFPPFYFFKKFGRHKSFLWGNWYPCFGLLVMFPLGFKARVGSCIHACRGIYVTCSLRFTSTATAANLLVASMAVKQFSSTYLWAGIGQAQNLNPSCHHSQCETRQMFCQLSYTLFKW